jgi:hypothetical protein
VEDIFLSGVHGLTVIDGKYHTMSLMAFQDQKTTRSGGGQLKFNSPELRSASFEKSIL